MELLKSGINSIFAIVLVLSIGAFGLITIESGPIFHIFRQMLLAGLGEPTTGLVVEGEQPELKCNLTAKEPTCEWE